MNRHTLSFPNTGGTTISRDTLWAFTHCLFTILLSASEFRLHRSENIQLLNSTNPLPLRLYHTNSTLVNIPGRYPVHIKLWKLSKKFTRST